VTTERITRKLNEEVVIFETLNEGASGARAVAPDHSPHAPHQPRTPLAQGAVPLEGAGLLHEVEQFLFHQAELLDGKCWQDYIDLFAADGIYWMPVAAQQTEWLDSPSIFIEDKPLMSIRMGRVTHPNAWSQAPMWGTSHVVGNVVIESVSEERLTVRSRFQMLELRRDAQRHFAGTYRHTLRRSGDGLRIELQRVDLLNSQAIFDYVLQIWV
jgi:3-phenylpropionate/cinnamic acid dioxygenase small subunit